MRHSAFFVVLLLALGFAAPAMAGDPSNPTAVSTPWGVLDFSLGSTPQSLPFRLQLNPRTVSSSSTPASSLVPYLSLGRTEIWNDELPDALRTPGDDSTGRLKTGAGLTWWLTPNAELTGEYQFMDIRRSGLSLRPSTIDRTLDAGLDSAGFSLNLSIKY